MWNVRCLCLDQAEKENSAAMGAPTMQPTTAGSDAAAENEAPGVPAEPRGTKREHPDAVPGPEQITRRTGAWLNFQAWLSFDRSPEVNTKQARRALSGKIAEATMMLEDAATGIEELFIEKWSSEFPKCQALLSMELTSKRLQ